jgi:hypothetical protein
MILVRYVFFCELASYYTCTYSMCACLSRSIIYILSPVFCIYVAGTRKAGILLPLASLPLHFFCMTMYVHVVISGLYQSL